MLSLVLIFGSVLSRTDTKMASAIRRMKVIITQIESVVTHHNTGHIVILKT
jgi:hypothetical protein